MRGELVLGSRLRPHTGTFIFCVMLMVPVVSSGAARTTMLAILGPAAAAARAPPPSELDRRAQGAPGLRPEPRGAVPECSSIAYAVTRARGGGTQWGPQFAPRVRAAAWGCAGRE